MRLHGIVLLVIVAAALAIRIYPSYTRVLGREEVDFLETDAFYHVRLVENQVRNFPWRVTVDPFAASGGQFVPIAPLYDTLTSAVVIVLYGRDASAGVVERTAAMMPPALGALVVIAVWALAAQLFGSRAGLFAAALVTTMPGHFLDRTMLGFVDHHALEALLSLLVILALVRAMRPAASMAAAMLPGVMLGLYLLTWASGAFLVALLGLWLFVVVVRSSSRDEVAAVARLLAGTAAVALALVLAFQDPRMYRYGTQVLALVGLAAISLVTRTAARRLSSIPLATTALAGAVVTAGIGVAVVWWWNPALLQQVASDLMRLTPDPERMAVREARPLFLYSGNWSWAEPWRVFGSSIFVGALALLLFTSVVWSNRRPADALIWAFAAGCLGATLGQNRFGYYLVPAFAVVSGWLTNRVLEWGGWFRARRAEAGTTDVPLQREVALAAAAAIVLAPSLATAKVVTEPQVMPPNHWLDAAFWLRQHTPTPFPAQGGEDYYYARYGPSVAEPDFTVMTWWDYGYLVTQRGRRVPVANPTQARATIAGRFYVETDEARAIALLGRERVRYALVDRDMPFRYSTEGRIMGQFQAVLDWAAATHDDYYEVCYRRSGGGWTPVWVFREAYYRSMTFRLMVANGAAMTPRKVTMITTADREDSRGMRFREILSERTFDTFEEAQKTVAAAVLAEASIVGLDPQQSPFPLEALQAFERAHDITLLGQPPSESALVRIFKVR
jgi:oligosaccharyl transferase (archaeosortase A-associated)